MKTKTLLLVTSLATLVGCAGTTSMNQDFTMSGTAEGLKAYGDFINGTLRTAKEDPKDHNEYMDMRKVHEREVTAREAIRNKAPKGFIQQLFGRDTTDENTVK